MLLEITLNVNDPITSYNHNRKYSLKKTSYFHSTQYIYNLSNEYLEIYNCNSKMILIFLSDLIVKNFTLNSYLFYTERQVFQNKNCIN